MGGSIETKAPRRDLLRGAAGLGLLGLGGCLSAAERPASPAAWSRRSMMAPIEARPDRLFDITVCLRPFRAAGPRLDVEEIGAVRVVHNYGHGGSGWSLSWGSSAVAVERAMERSPREVAVLGCGALGITSAILAQRAGAQVTIYARDLLPQTRSARATGTWTPDSRIALSDVASPAFGDLWERMARLSFRTYRQYLGLPGMPVEWVDRYRVDDGAPREADPPGALAFASFGDRIADLTPDFQVLTPADSPFQARRVARSSTMMFNLADYGHTLLSDFLLAGGRIERREFRSPAELGTLKQAVVIDCPGVAARELWQDGSVVPVRGQIGWLPPQPQTNYGVLYKGLNLLGRRDGVCVQDVSGGDMRGYGDADETPRRPESERAVAVAAELFARHWRG